MIVIDFNAFHQRANKVATAQPIELLESRGDFGAKCLQPTDDELEFGVVMTFLANPALF